MNGVFGNHLRCMSDFSFWLMSDDFFIPLGTCVAVEIGVCEYVMMVFVFGIGSKVTVVVCGVVYAGCGMLVLDVIVSIPSL